MDLLPRLPVLGIVARVALVRKFVLGLDEAEACFGGSMTGEACRSMVPAKCYAAHSGEFADSPRQGRL